MTTTDPAIYAATLAANLDTMLAHLAALVAIADNTPPPAGATLYNDRENPLTVTGPRGATATIPSVRVDTEHGKPGYHVWIESATINGVEYTGGADVVVSRPYDHGTDTYGTPTLAGNAWRVSRRDTWQSPPSDAARKTLAGLLVAAVVECGGSVEHATQTAPLVAAYDAVRAVFSDAAIRHPRDRDARTAIAAIEQVA